MEREKQEREKKLAEKAEGPKEAPVEEVKEVKEVVKEEKPVRDFRKAVTSPKAAASIPDTVINWRDKTAPRLNPFEKKQEKEKKREAPRPYNPKPIFLKEDKIDVKSKNAFDCLNNE